MVKNTNCHEYHWHVTQYKSVAAKKRYCKFYNKALDMFINGSVAWPPSAIDVYGSECIEKIDVTALEHAVGDAVIDIYVLAQIMHPRWYNHMAMSGGQNASESLRLWKEDEQEFDYNKVIGELRISPDQI